MKVRSKKDYAKSAVENKNTPLDNWSVEIDPAIMSGDEWVDIKNDIGNKAIENEELSEGIVPHSSIFMHPTHDVSYGKD